VLDRTSRSTPYVAAHRGESSPAYAGLEDSLARALGVSTRTAVRSAGPAGRAPVAGPRGPWWDEIFPESGRPVTAGDSASVPVRAPGPQRGQPLPRSRAPRRRPSGPERPADPDRAWDPSWARLPAVLLASGTAGFGHEVAGVIDLEALGGIVTKAVTPEPRRGHPGPRVAEFRGGMLNAVGLANPGLDQVAAADLPWLRRLRRARVIVNVAGATVDDYARGRASGA
jgi:hypothetical protein